MEKLAWVLVYLFLNWLYLPLSRRPVKYYWKIKIDDKIPLVPGMVVSYLSYALLFVGGGLVLVWSEQFWPLAKAMIVAQLTADIIWYLFPNGVKRPTVNGQGLMVGWLRKLYAFNRHDANGCPSAHVFHALIVGHFLARLWPQFSPFIYVWAGLIVVSTVLIKQHYLLDVLGGILVAAIALWV